MRHLRKSCCWMRMQPSPGKCPPIPRQFPSTGNFKRRLPTIRHDRSRPYLLMHLRCFHTIREFGDRQVKAKARVDSRRPARSQRARGRFGNMRAAGVGNDDVRCRDPNHLTCFLKDVVVRGRCTVECNSPDPLHQPHSHVRDGAWWIRAVTKKFRTQRSWSAMINTIFGDNPPGVPRRKIGRFTPGASGYHQFPRPFVCRRFLVHSCSS